MWYLADRSGATRRHWDPDSEVETDHDLYVEDLDSDDSEYGSYFYASIAMPPFQDLIPISSHRPHGVTCFFSEESISEPTILLYHEWLLSNQWHYIWGISDRVWLFSQSMSPIQTPFMSSLRFTVGLNPL